MLICYISILCFWKKVWWHFRLWIYEVFVDIVLGKGSVKPGTTLANLIVFPYEDQLGIAYLQYGNAILRFLLNLWLLGQGRFSAIGWRIKITSHLISAKQKIVLEPLLTFTLLMWVFSRVEEYLRLPKSNVICFMMSCKIFNHCMVVLESRRR